MQLDDAHATEKIFGGKTMVLGGDFRQILLVVPRGGQKDIVSVSLPQSHLW
jgi:ATP-dependent DNA helicase PIF1